MSLIKLNLQARTYRNQSQIIFNDSYTQSNENIQKRPKIKTSMSYKNHSTISELLTDNQPIEQLTDEVRYKNNIQTIDQKYSVPKRCKTSKPERQNKFSQFFQNNNSKFIKPSLQNTQFSDTISKNEILLRRGQFDGPTMKSTYGGFKKVSFNPSSKFTNSKTTNFIKTKFKTNKYFCSSILQCNKIKKQSQAYFSFKNQKDPFKASIAQHASKYRQLLKKQRQAQDDKVLRNALNRMLVMEVIGDKITHSQFNPQKY